VWASVEEKPGESPVAISAKHSARSSCSQTHAGSRPAEAQQHGYAYFLAFTKHFLPLHRWLQRFMQLLLDRFQQVADGMFNARPKKERDGNFSSSSA
jgi:hypothetical protein